MRSTPRTIHAQARLCDGRLRHVSPAPAAQAKSSRELPADAQRSDLDGERLRAGGSVGRTAKLCDVRQRQGGSRSQCGRVSDPIPRTARGVRGRSIRGRDAGAALATLPANQRIYKAIAKVGQIEDCNPPKAQRRAAVDHRNVPRRTRCSIDPDAARRFATTSATTSAALTTSWPSSRSSCSGGPISAAELVAERQHSSASRRCGT